MKDTDHATKKKIWNRLIEVAMADGIYSREEEELLTNIIMDVEKYSKLLDDALEDGVIDDHDRVDLFEGRMNIVEKAYQAARKDMVITKDETEILKTICMVILEFEKEFNPDDA